MNPIQPILWVDDDWAREGPAEILSEVEVRLKRALLAADLDDAILRMSSAAEAVVRLTYGPPSSEEARFARVPDFSLLIVDILYKDQAYDWERVVQAARDRRIPYVIYAVRANEFLQNARMTPDDPLFCGCFDKAEAASPMTDAFEAAIVDILFTPPLRLVIMSDLHVQAETALSATPPDQRAGLEVERRDQAASFVALVKTLNALSQEAVFSGLVLSGDFSSKDPNHDLLEAAGTIEGLVEATVGRENLQRLFMVPGNHDLVWRSFEGCELDPTPWARYLQLYEAIFAHRRDLLAEMSAMRGPTRDRYKAVAAGLAWRRDLPDLKLSVIGLVSVIDDGERGTRGQGRVSAEQIGFIKEAWSCEKRQGWLRVVVLHHNLFAVISLSGYDVSEPVINCGETLAALVDAGCDLILSGHVHLPGLVRHAVSMLDGSGDAWPRVIMAVSTGTVGWHHPSKDVKPSFSILNVGRRDPKTGNRRVWVEEYHYHRQKQRWLQAGVVHGS